MMALAGIGMHPRPVQPSTYSVLKSPDIPSVLLELGFISDDQDRANLLNPQWRERMVRSVGDAIVGWARDEAARAALLRAEAERDRAGIALENRSLRAPFGGVVGLTDLVEGQLIDTATPIATLDDLSVIEVDFSVPENALEQLRNGQRVSITVDAFSGDVYGGQVVAIDPVIDPDSRSARLRAQIANPDGRLRPGQFAQLQLDTGGNTSSTALLVPEQALMQDGNTRFVYTVVAGKAHRAEIKTGTRVASTLIRRNPAMAAAAAAGAGVLWYLARRQAKHAAQGPIDSTSTRVEAKRAGARSGNGQARAQPRKTTARSGARKATSPSQ